MIGEKRARVTICNQRGLHARAAARFVRIVEQYDASVRVKRQDMEVCGKSIMGLMMLAASQGSEIELTARGRQADAVIEALSALITAKFDEEV